MDIFGIGPLEFFLVLLVALIFLGPKDLVKAGRTLGRFLRKIVLSEEWRTIQAAGKEIQQLPTRLIREAGIDEVKQELGEIDPRKAAAQLQQDYSKWQKDMSAWMTPPPLDQDDSPEIKSDEKSDPPNIQGPSTT